MTVLTGTQIKTTQKIGFLPILAAATLGVVLIYFTDFAAAAQFHDSAHDTRHTLAFPCH